MHMHTGDRKNGLLRQKKGRRAHQFRPDKDATGAKRLDWQSGRPVRYVTYYKDFLLDNKRKYTLSEWEVISTRTKTWRRPPNTIFEIAFKKRPLDLTGKWEYYKNFIPELQPRQSIPTLAKAPGATKHGAAYTATNVHRSFKKFFEFRGYGGTTDSLRIRVR